MQKSPTKKLTLNKETVRKLNETELRQVAGGTGSFLCGGRSRFGCDCTGTSNPPTSPTMCPTE